MIFNHIFIDIALYWHYLYAFYEKIWVLTPETVICYISELKKSLVRLGCNEVTGNIWSTVYCLLFVAGAIWLRHEHLLTDRLDAIDGHKGTVAIIACRFEMFCFKRRPTKPKISYFCFLKHRRFLWSVDLHRNTTILKEIHMYNKKS